MAKHKVADLEGWRLDAAVALAQGAVHSTGPDGRDPPHWRFPDGAVQVLGYYTPSTDWFLGGPLIERERMLICSPHDDAPPARMWQACFPFGNQCLSWGPTPLVAAMRAFVASKLGEEVELP